MSDILNIKATKELALKISHDRGRPFKRVGEDFLDEFTEECRRLLVSKIHRHPAIGVTLKASFPRTEK